MNFNLFFYIVRIFKTAFVPSKIWNLIRLHTSYQLSRLGILTKWRTFPSFISIEPTNVCNLDCPECPVGTRTIPVKAINSTLENTEKTLNELKSKLTHVIFYFQGEPLLNKLFPKMVRLAHERSILSSTSTNAQLINDETARAIVESGLDRIIISIDGATQETYQSYRVGGKLEKAKKAIELLVKWKKELKSHLPIVEIQFLVLKTNEHEMDNMKKMKKELKADKLTFKSAQLYDFENGNPLLTNKKKYARYELKEDGKYHIKSPLKNSCKRLWMGTVVNSKGELLPCCFDKDSKFKLGDTTEDSLMNGWHSDKAYKFREQILKNRKQFEICRNCTER